MLTLQRQTRIMQTQKPKGDVEGEEQHGADGKAAAVAAARCGAASGAQALQQRSGWHRHVQLCTPYLSFVGRAVSGEGLRARAVGRPAARVH